jgi:hypothetical protein
MTLNPWKLFKMVSVWLNEQDKVNILLWETRLSDEEIGCMCYINNVIQPMWHSYDGLPPIPLSRGRVHCPVHPVPVTNKP